MPKESISINNFQTGIISNVSERDIPIDAASESLNIDPLGEKGSLRGLYDDTTVVDGVGTNEQFPLYQEHAIINDDGTYHMVGWRPRTFGNVQNQNLASLKDPFTDTTPVEISSSLNINANNHLCCMEVNNKEVHIGLGDHISKWFGMVQYKQFGVANAGATFGFPTLEDAELRSPSNFPDMYKVIHGDTNYLYGIKWQGNYVYKFHKTNLTITKSQKRFKSLQGLCIFNDGDLSDRSSYIWVYDAGEGQYGTLYKYSVSLGVSEEFSSTLDIPTAAVDKWKVNEISDIIHTEAGSADAIWFYRPIQEDDYPESDLNTGEGAWLWSIAVPTTSGSPELASKSPTLTSTSNAASSTQGEWFGLHEDGIFYDHEEDYDHTDQDSLADVKASFLDDEQVNDGTTNLYSDPSSNYNRFICAGLHWDKEDEILLGFYPDWAEDVSGGIDAGSAKLALMKVDSSPAAFGTITVESIHNVGWDGATEHYHGYPDTATGPDHSSSTYDSINKIFFCSADFFVWAHKLTGTEVSSSSDITHANNKAHVIDGSHSTGEIRFLRCDAESKLLFICNETYGVSIHPYLSTGKILCNAPSKVRYTDGTNVASGLALDTKNKFAFIGYDGYKITSLSYSPSEDPDTEGTSFSVVTDKISCQTSSHVTGASPLAVDSENRLVFASFRNDAVDDAIIESFSYDENGNLSQVDYVNGHTTYNGINNNYRPMQMGGVDSGLPSDMLDIKVDEESKVVMVHNGEEILSFKYNADGTFENNDINSMEYKNNRVTYVDANQHDQQAAKEGLGLSLELIQLGSDFGAQSKKGLLMVGSNTGRIRSKAYARHTAKVYMPKAGFTLVQNSNDSVGIPVCFNNSLEDREQGNHIYYVGDATGSGSRTVKSQMYWFMIEHGINPAANEGLDGTHGECIAATLNDTTEGPAKLYSVDVNQYTYKKLVYTGSTVEDGKDKTSLYIYDAASAHSNPDFNTTNDNRLSPATGGTLSGINLKEACAVIQNDADSGDAIVDLFEGSVRGTGKWARATFDRSDSEWDHPSNSSGTAGGLIAAPVDMKFDLISDEDDEETGKGVKKNNKYFYKASYLYDGYQEGPLSDEFTFTPEEDGNLRVTIQLKGLSSLPSRVSHLNLYRSETDDLKSSKPLGYYRLCDSLRLDSRWTQETISNESNPDWGSYRQFRYLDEGSLGVSFESSSGYSSSLQDVNLNYGLSTQLNNIHFVSNIFNPVLDEEGGNFIAKSLPYKFDTFDITKDILRLPEKLRAMKGFAGRIWGFSENKMFKIEPNALYVEDSSDGIGCVHHKSIVVTPLGMFWADKSNIYWHNGQSISPIGEAIKAGSTYSWDKVEFEGSGGDELDTSAEVEVDTTNHCQPVIAVWSSKFQSVFFMFKLDSDNYHYAQMFHVPTKRWEVVKLNGGLGKIIGAAEGPDGYIHYWTNENDSASTGQKMYKLAANTGSRRAYHWHSKEITIETPDQDKHFHNIKLIGTNTDLSGNIVFKLDGSSITESFEAEGSNGKYTLPFGSRKGKNLKIEMTNITGTNEIDSIGITFRRKRAK